MYETIGQASEASGTDSFFSRKQVLESSLGIVPFWGCLYISVSSMTTFLASGHFKLG